MYPIYVYVVILKAMSPKSSPSRRSRPSRNPSSHFHQLQQDGVLKSNSVLLQTSEKQQMGYSVSIFSGRFLTQGGAIALGYMNRTSITFIYFLMVLFSVVKRLAFFPGSGPGWIILTWSYFRGSYNKRWMSTNVPVNLVLLLVPTFKAAMGKKKKAVIILIGNSYNVCIFRFL